MCNFHTVGKQHCFKNSGLLLSSNERPNEVNNTENTVKYHCFFISTFKVRQH